MAACLVELRNGAGVYASLDQNTHYADIFSPNSVRRGQHFFSPFLRKHSFIRGPFAHHGTDIGLAMSALQSLEVAAPCRKLTCRGPYRNQLRVSSAGCAE